MNEWIALSVFLIFSFSTLFLVVKGRIGNGAAMVFLSFSILAGWGIAGYDRLRGNWAGESTIDDFRTAAEAAKADMLTELRKEAEAHKSSMELMVKAVDSSRDRIDAQARVVESAVEGMRKIEEGIRREGEKSRELHENLVLLREQAAAIYRASGELALVLARVIYLQSETKDSQGRSVQAALQQVMDGLDEIVNIVLEEPEERARFVSEVLNSVEKKEQR